MTIFREKNQNVYFCIFPASENVKYYPRAKINDVFKN